MNASLLPRRCGLIAAALSLFAVSVVAQAPGDVRVALVIGNAAYASSPLVNAANDAKAMAGTLKGLGFTVIELRDGDKAAMANAIANAHSTLKGKQGIGMLYYAGHGLQVDARNYMVPVDARLSKAADVPAQTVDVGAVIEAFKGAGNRMNILVLDACRDNPFGGIVTGKGLAPLDAPSGTFLAYATAPGNVAGDGDAKSGNGLYTQYLLEELKKPQARIEDVFKRVRFAVRKASGGRQIPWESTSLEEDFQFNSGRLVAATAPTGEQLRASFSQEKADWDRIKDSANPDDFYAFLQKYPSGTISEAAHSRLNVVQKPGLRVQEVGGGQQQYAAAQLRLGDLFETRYTSTTKEVTPTIVVEEVTRIEAGHSEMTVRHPLEPGVAEQIWIRDSLGGIKAFPQATYDPPQQLVPGGLLQVGRSWTSVYQVTFAPPSTTAPRLVTAEGRIVARETIKVPAGTFDVFRIDLRGRSVNAQGERTLPPAVYWMSPEIPIPVKTERPVRVEGVVVATHTSELMRVVRGK